jgi:hypothetical protein
MRRPRLRFTVLGLMLAVAGLGLLLALAIRMHPQPVKITILNEGGLPDDLVRRLRDVSRAGRADAESERGRTLRRWFLAADQVVGWDDHVVHLAYVVAIRTDSRGTPGLTVAGRVGRSPSTTARPARHRRPGCLCLRLRRGLPPAHPARLVAGGCAQV